MEKISQILGITPEQLETERFNAYWKWCESLTTTVLETQKVLAFSDMSRYYNTELAKWEKEFLFRVNKYQDSPTVSNADKKRLYDQCVENGNKMCRPIPLILLATHTTPKDKSLTNNIAFVAVKGVKLDRLTLRLN